MSIPKLYDGAVTFTGSFNLVCWDEDGSQTTFGFKPPKGEKFVVMLVGTAPKAAQDFDVHGALNQLGFVEKQPALSIDRLAEIIRKVDGNHSLGAGALAERIIQELEGASPDCSHCGGDCSAANPPVHDCPAGRAAWIDKNVQGSPELVEAMKNIAGCGSEQP